MKKREQILLKKQILSDAFNSFKSTHGQSYHYGVKIGRETFQLVGTTDEGHLIADRDVVINAKEAKTGSFVVIHDLPFYVIEGEPRMVLLRLLCAIIPDENNIEVNFLFDDDDLSLIEKEFILEDYPKDSEIEIKGTTFMVTKNNNMEISLIPIMSSLWYKSSNDGSKQRFIDNGKIVEETMR